MNLHQCFSLVFFDDILIYSPDMDKHVNHLRTVLTALQEHHLYVNAKKCFFGQHYVEYLGHIISDKGVATTEVKIKPMLNWPVPKSLKELKGFLGLTGYYRKFVAGYGQILRKDTFNWNTTADEAFQCLNKAMSIVPVLALLDFLKPFIIDIDALGYGLARF